MKHFYTRFKSLQSGKVSALFLFCIIFILQCVVCQGLGAQSVRLQVVNFATTVGAFDLYANGTKLIDDLPALSATELLEISNTGSVEFVAAPASSTSVADGVAQGVFTLVSNDKYIIVFYEKQENTGTTPVLMQLANYNEFSSDPTQAEVAFSHIVPNAPAMNILLRSGGMIVGDLAFGGTAADIALPTDDNYLDIKTAGSTNILGTYRLSLQGTQGKVTRVFLTGNTQNNSTLKLYSLDEEGWLFPVDAAPIARVQFVNALPITVDIFKNGTRFADDASSGSALAFKYIPAGIPMNIAICDQNSLTAQSPFSSTAFTFQNMVSYTAIAAGSMNAPSMFLHHSSREVAVDSNAVDILFFNGISSSPLVEVVDGDGAVVFGATAFGTYSEYITEEKNEFVFVVKEVMTGNVLGAYKATDLQQHKGKALTMLLTPGANAPALWVVDALGEATVLAPVVVSALEQASKASAVRIGANPVESEINLYGLSAEQSYTYNIIGLAGQVYKSGNINFEERSTVIAGGLSSGMYILNLVDQTGYTRNIKFIQK